MKSKLLFLLLLLGSSYITAQTVIENPPFRNTSGKYTHHLENRTLANRNPTDDTDCVPPAMVDQSGRTAWTYIYAPESKKQLYPLRIEGRKFGEQVTTPASGIIEGRLCHHLSSLARRHYPG